ncbi:hypothetical protein NKH77_04165 [Streptomyces sp. M19]
MSAESRQQVVGRLPHPVQHMLRQKFEPEYASTPRWTTPTA